MNLTRLKCHSLGVLTILLLFAATFYSCKKTDNISLNDRRSYIEKFFKEPAASSPELQAIIDLLKEENNKTGFVNTLPDNAGLPVWNKLIAQKSKNNYAARGIIADKDGNYLIPLSNNNKTLSALLFAMKKDGKYEFYCYDNNYAYGIAFSGDKYTIKERQMVMGLFMAMSNYVFGTTKFKSIPKDLFSGYEGKEEENGITKKVFLTLKEGTLPDIFISDRVVGTNTACFWVFTGTCTCHAGCKSPSCCDHPNSECPRGECTKQECMTIITENDGPPAPPSGNDNSDGNTGQSTATSTTSWSSGFSGALPGTTNNLSNSPCGIYNCSWYTEAPEQNFDQTPNTEDYLKVSTQLNQILGDGDSYTFQSINSSDALGFSSVDEFKNYIGNIDQNTTYNISVPPIIIQEDEKILKAENVINLIAGITFYTKIKKNAQHIWEVVDVTSSEWGVTLAWSWEQKSYSISFDPGGKIIVDIIGYKNYNIFVEGIGTVYKKEVHYQIKIDQLNGTITAFTKI